VQKVPNAIQYALEVPRTQADQLSWAHALGPLLSHPPCFSLQSVPALGQQAATTPKQAEKELEIKKKEVKQTELDLQKKGDRAGY
jgi:hypothetical protein